MTRNLRISALALVILVAVATAWPRAARAASVYSMVLVGERLEAGDVRSIMLGSSAHLIGDTLSSMHYNQALLAKLHRVTVGASQFVAMDEGRTETLAEQDNSFAITTLQGAFPIYNKLVFAIGYRGRYNPDGSFSLREVAPSGETYTETFSKSGGLFSIPFTAAFQVTRYISLAGTFSLERGYVEERWDKVFDSSQFNPGASIKREELSGSGYGVAVIVHPASRLMVGGTFESEIDYDSDVTTRYTQPGLDSTYTASLKLPARYTIGASLAVTGWLLAASGFYSNFEDFEGLAFDRSRLRPEWDAAFGLEWTDGVPIRRSRIPLRLSVTFGQLPFDHPREPGAAKGEAVKKLLFGIGTGMKIRGGKGKIDIGFQMGRIGSLGKNGLEDHILRFYFGVAGGEEWKRKGQGGY